MSAGVGHCEIRCPSARCQGVQAWLTTQRRSTYAQMRLSPAMKDRSAQASSSSTPRCCPLWLGIEATKSRKQRRTLRQIHTDSAQKGENQELIHIVSTFCSQRVWVNIRWKTRVRLQRNSTVRVPNFPKKGDIQLGIGGKCNNAIYGSSCKINRERTV